jgi:phi13 family phage major tail protein
MAFYGLSNPYMAQLDATAETYSNGFKCGKAISTAVTPNYSSQSLYADDSEAERVDEFVNAAVTVGTDRLPSQAAPILFGHTQTGGEEVSKSSDAGRYVGYGFWVSKMEDGVKTYKGVVLHKVKFTEGEESYQTKGDQITFQTPNLSGNATTLNDGTWRTKSPDFVQLINADVWVRNMLNIAVTYTQVTDPASGASPKAEGWYERTGTGTTEDPYVYTLSTATEVGSGTYYKADAYSAT